ncbi:S41 family peptidase [bacterium]|nr:S41 family peptidase [bacterium]
MRVLRSFLTSRFLTSGWPLAAILGAALAFAHQGTLLRVPESGDDGLATVAHVHDLIVKNWVEDPEVRRERLRYGAVEGMASQLDPYSDFIPPEKKQRYEEDINGEFGGLGIWISIDKGQVVVTCPFEGTPAWEAGILPDDRILEIDGKTYSVQTAEEAQGKLRGKLGSKVTLLVSNERRPAPVTISLKRDTIKVVSARSARLVEPDAKIGYVHLDKFQEPTFEELKRSLSDLMKQGMSALVLDVRGNSGGLLASAVDIASCFLEPGETVVVTRGRAGRDESRTLARPGKDSPRVRVPLAVLIDQDSASASEVLAGALRGNVRATLVGTRSYGKGSVQSLYPIDDGKAKLKLTTHYFYAPYTPLRKIHRVATERAVCPTCGTTLRHAVEGAVENDEWGLLPDIPVACDDKLRRRLLQQESELEIDTLRKKKDPTAPTRTQGASVRDPQLDAAVSHLKLVLEGKAKLGVPSAPLPGDTAAVPSGTGSATEGPPGGG